MKKLLTAAVIAIAGAMAAIPAQATTITFDDISATTATFVDQGFQFSGGTVGNFSASPNYRSSYSGSNALMNNAPITLTKVGGGAFSVSDFYIESASWMGFSAQMLVTGYLQGQIVGTALSFATGSSPWKDISMTMGPIDSLTFTTTDGIGFILDNVTANAATAVPEPMSMAMLGSGLFGLGMIRRRQAKRTAA